MRVISWRQKQSSLMCSAERIFPDGTGTVKTVVPWIAKNMRFNPFNRMKGNSHEQHRLSRWRRRYRFGDLGVCWRILKFKRTIKDALE